MATLCVVVQDVVRGSKTGIQVSGIAWFEGQRDDLGTPGWSVSLPISADALTITAACRDAAVAAVAPFGLTVNTLTDKIVIYGGTPVVAASV